MRRSAMPDATSRLSPRIRDFAAGVLLAFSLPAFGTTAPGDVSFRKGQFQESLDVWEQALKTSEAEGRREDTLRNLLRMAVAQTALGLHQAALATLGRAHELAERHPELAVHNAEISGQIGSVYALAGLPEEAEKALRQAVGDARKGGQWALAGAFSNDLGGVLLDRGAWPEAQKSFEESLRLATREKQPELAAKASVNLLKSALGGHDFTSIVQRYETAKRLAHDLPESHDKAFSLTALGRVLQKLPQALSERTQSLLKPLAGPLRACLSESGAVTPSAREPSNRNADLGDLPDWLAVKFLMESKDGADCLERHLAPDRSKGARLNLRRVEVREQLYALDEWKRFASLIRAEGVGELEERRPRELSGLYREAIETAQAVGDVRAESYAEGYLGQLYESAGRSGDALELTRRAAFLAQQIDAPELLYLWYWQSGRLLKAESQIPAAIDAYRLAAQYLRELRNSLTSNYSERTSSLNRDGVAVFSELADLLLNRSAVENDSARVQATLSEALGTLEWMKTTEVEDYFQSDCELSLKAKTTQLDHPPARTAVIYPVLLNERTELIATSADGIRQFTVPVGRAELVERVHALREALETRRGDFLTHARKLHGWLVEPLAPLLKNREIDTLIVVPDGPLRTIPWAVLHDGKQFLIERYALATTPGLTLTDLRAGPRERTNILVNAVSEAVQGFPALPAAAEEAQAVQRSFGGKSLINEQYLLENIRQEVAATPYSIVHIASHGQFSPDLENTYVLTFDRKLNPNQLEQLLGLGKYREDPIELLTLSACQTAAGDDRAALGLAGIAVKAGARSVLATLWSIGDESSALLMSEFYRLLKEQPAWPKARVLREAQLEFLKRYPQFRHPFFWSPFLLIGNWL